jgi:membrane peptidoglycan carboxypeptidase
MSKTSNKPHKNKCKRRKTVSKIIISVTAFAILSALFFTLYFIEKRNDAAKNLDLVHYIEAPKRERSKIYHYDFTNRAQREGELSEEYDEIVGGYQSIYTPIDNMPEHLKYAFVAIEDHRFYRHQGVDWVTTIQACARMFFGGVKTEFIVKHFIGIRYNMRQSNLLTRNYFLNYTCFIAVIF